MVTAEEMTNPKCVNGADGVGEPGVILWGDSNAAHYVGMLDVFGRSAGFRFRNVEIGSCPPIDGDPGPFVEARRETDCRASLEMIRPVDRSRTRS